MVCIYCNADTGVSNSRLQKRLNQVWRRRQCKSCHAVFTTLEAIDWGQSLMVRKTSGHIEPFSRDNLLISLYESCKHRQTAIEDANGLLLAILPGLREQQCDGMLTHNQITMTSLGVLKRFDNTAATMYAAYHPVISSSSSESER